jgi:hypothetical protein
MAKQILSVGYDFPGGVVDYVELDSTQSLLDADIIVFEPGLGEYSVESTYNGKPSLYDRDSFKVKERVQHWRRELQAAINTGKFVVVFMVAPEEVFVKTGENSVSGTGRNARVTKYVTPLSSYTALPFDLEGVVAATGTGIVPSGDLKYFATLWKEFGARFRYETYFNGAFTDVLLKTRSANRIVGAASRTGKGMALFLPPLAYEDEELLEDEDEKLVEDEDEEFAEDEENDKTQRWSTGAIEIGKRLLQCLVEVSKAVSTEAQITPPPGWVSDSRYRLFVESDIEKSIRVVSAEVERLHAEREALLGQLQTAGGLRRLLFEKGPQLEQAILEALNLIGFHAEPFRDGESEFDAVFTSEEGRFLGEAEGKDNYPVNIDKLSQLERNIQEDFQRDEVSLPAKGVLFGNAYRLHKPEERNDYFTTKCRSGAARTRIALARTPDLFMVARYLKEHDDPAYAKTCRIALLEAEGCEVQFPAPPSVEAVPSETKVVGVKDDD